MSNYNKLHKMLSIQECYCIYLAISFITHIPIDYKGINKGFNYRTRSQVRNLPRALRFDCGVSWSALKRKGVKLVNINKQ